MNFHVVKCLNTLSIKEKLNNFLPLLSEYRLKITKICHDAHEAARRRITRFLECGISFFPESADLPQIAKLSVEDIICSFCASICIHVGSTLE